MDTATKAQGLFAIEALFGEEHAWVSPWVEHLPPRYFKEMARLVCDWQPEIYGFDTAAKRCNVQAQTFVRLSQAHDFFLPWLNEALSLQGVRVLEIGSGSGSSTAALLSAGAEVLGLEINREAVTIAEARCDLLGLPHVRFEAIAPDWLKSNYDWDRLRETFAPQVVVCYALIEHLTPAERLTLLHHAMRVLPVGGHLVTFETPNRLMPVDWHSSHLLFAEVLPDWLLRRYLTLSPRADAPGLKRTTLDETPEDDTRLYRWGRGVSFHEFQLAIGLDRFTVIHDGYSPRITHSPNRRVTEDYETALSRILAEQGVAPGFARPSLDLIIRKTDEPRQAL